MNPFRLPPPFFPELSFSLPFLVPDIAITKLDGCVDPLRVLDVRGITGDLVLKERDDDVVFQG